MDKNECQLQGKGAFINTASDTNAVARPPTEHAVRLKRMTAVSANTELRSDRKLRLWRSSWDREGGRPAASQRGFDGSPSTPRSRAVLVVVHRHVDRRVERARELLLHPRQLQGEVLAQIHDVLHHGRVRAAQLQYHFHELPEGDHLLLLEDVVSEVHEANHIHADVLQSPERPRDLEDFLKFQSRYVAVPVCVQVVDILHQVVFQHRHIHLLLLNGGDILHDLHEHSHKHVHHGERAQEDEEQQGRGQEKVLAGHAPHEVCLVRQDPLHEQVAHRPEDSLEVHLLHLGALGQLHERDCEDVHNDHQQKQGVADGPDRHRHALDQYHQLRHEATQFADPGHPQQPEQAHDPEDGSVAEATIGGVHGTRRRECDDHGHNPRFQDHGGNEERIENEPFVQEAILFPLKRHEAHKALEEKVRAEKVFHQLEHNG
mmetsp:Transcript_111861/g.316733  ORF Transcript_111861/g.316733 Transcript_111861/m.316733 type:complete len:431 (-) Transcript_111861:1521-2813(-)